MVPFSSSSGGLTVDQTAPSAMSISERQPDEYLMHVISKRKPSQWYRISTGSASNPINLPLSGPRIWMRNPWQKLRLQVCKCSRYAIFDSEKAVVETTVELTFNPPYVIMQTQFNSPTRRSYPERRRERPVDASTTCFSSIVR